MRPPRRLHRAAAIGALTLSACLARFEVGEPASDSGESAATEADGASASDETATSSDETGPEDCGETCDPMLELCVEGECACRPGFDRCSGLCVDLDSDPNNCGECGESCDVGACEDGECRADGCSENDECAGACVELDTSPLHCGACQSPCMGDELCIEGECVGYALLDCDSDLDCGAGTCCELDHGGESEHVCVNGAQCPS